MFAQKVSMLRWSREIEDQGSLGACVSNSDVSAIELITYRANHIYDLSRLGLYHDTLGYEGRLQPGEEGLSPVDALIVGSTIGIGDESLHPYNVYNALGIPSQAYYADASTQKITHYREITLNPDDFMASTNAIKEELSKGNPVVVAFNAVEWERHISGPLETQNIIDTTVPNYMGAIGKHQWVIEGYDDTLSGGSFLVENSWASDWGWNGIGAISYTLTHDMYYAAVIDGFGTMDFRYTLERTEAAQLYVSLFGRAPEHGGQDYWAGRLSGETMVAVAQAIYDCEPARIYYPSNASNSDVIGSFYINVLGRTADQGGLDYWTSRLNAGESKGSVIVAMIQAVDGYAGTDTVALASQHLLDNKVAVGMHYGVTLQAEDLTVAQVALVGVTSDINGIDAAKSHLSDLLGWA